MGSIEQLKRNLLTAKEELKRVDGNIKKLTGRDPNDERILRKPIDANIKRPGARFDGRANASKPDSDSTRKSTEPEGTSTAKKTVDDDLEVSLASSVVCVSDTRSRLDATKGLQKSDKERGRRMLGVLQGTLRQFQAESLAATKRPQMERRRQVDAKLEARAKEEKEELRRERAELFRTRREHHMEINLLQQRIRLMKAFETWKEEQLKMKTFCRTAKPPYLFYKPKVHNAETRWRMELTGRAIDEMIDRRRQELETEIDEAPMIKRRRIGDHQGASSDEAYSPVHNPDAKRKLNSQVGTKPNLKKKLKRGWDVGELSDASDGERSDNRQRRSSLTTATTYSTIVKQPTTMHQSATVAI